ncbi:MAG: hypothetical protein WCC77_05730, partial [Pseudolabrys sp.]
HRRRRDAWETRSRVLRELSPAALIPRLANRHLEIPEAKFRARMDDDGSQGRLSPRWVRLIPRITERIIYHGRRWNRG